MHGLGMEPNQHHGRKVMLLSNGWRWSVRFAAGLATAIACTAPAFASMDGYDAVSDPNSVYNAAQTVMGADAFYRSGITGRGVDVAVIDTGVNAVKGLDGDNKVIHGPDLSFDSQNDVLRHKDVYGHGTHMAGIIAGKDAGATGAGDGDHFQGVAPDARIVSVKVGEAYGTADVSQVVAAIDWVTKNRQSNGMNIRVLNLSYGTDANQAYTIDPIAHAVEQAWKAGIFVVVAGGNSGYGTTQLNDPALNPFVMAVGSTDSRGTRGAWDDTVPDWSSTGDSTRPPDVVAPGRSLTSLHVPGGVVEEQFPEAVVAERFVRGSGTSQSAAMVSGAAALIIQQRPWIYPDALKALLRNTAERLPNAENRAQGQGLVNLDRAKVRSTPITFQLHAPSTGLGSLEQARGGSHIEAVEILVDEATGAETENVYPLEGEIDIFGRAWNAPVWAAASKTRTSWVGGAFNGVLWTGDSLLSGLWQAVGWDDQTDWTGARWTGARWTEANWEGARWTGARWTGARWTGARWTGARWTGARWTGARWTGARWTGARWTGARWTGARWTGARWSSAGWGAAAPVDPTPTIEEVAVPAPTYEVKAEGAEVAGVVEPEPQFDPVADAAAVQAAADASAKVPDLQ
jgi:serine protease AprX